MYWWNAFKLAEDLREGRVEEKERLKYYLGYTVAASVVVQPGPYFPETLNTVKFISGNANLIIIFIGTMLCYRANRSGDNTDFIGRMICLSWPVGIPFSVLFLTSALYIYVSFGIEFDSATIFLAIYSAVYWILFYGLLYKCVTIVAQPKKVP